MKNILFAVFVLLGFSKTGVSQTIFGYDVDVTKPPDDMQFTQEIEYEDEGQKFIMKIYSSKNVPEMLDEVEYKETTKVGYRKYFINFSFIKNKISKKDFKDYYDKLCDLFDGRFKKISNEKDQEYTWYTCGIFNDGTITIHRYQGGLILTTSKMYTY